MKMNKTVPSIDPGVIPELKSYSFPGNIRELKNITERAIILCKGDSLVIEDFPLEYGKRHLSFPEDKSFNLRKVEKDLIQLALRRNDYNQTVAANQLGITRDSLIRRMKKYGIVIQKGGIDI